MADDALPDPAELVAARAKLDHQIGGLAAISNDPMSPELKDKIESVLTERSRREGLIGAALNARDAYIAALALLAADGYPDLAPVTIAPDLLAEAKARQTDIEAAFSIFAPAPLAAVVNVELGSAVPKPKP